VRLGADVVNLNQLRSADELAFGYLDDVLTHRDRGSRLGLHQVGRHFTGHLEPNWCPWRSRIVTPGHPFTRRQVKDDVR
jgi:hypothetical protein